MLEPSLLCALQRLWDCIDTLALDGNTESMQKKLWSHKLITFECKLTQEVTTKSIEKKWTYTVMNEKPDSSTSRYADEKPQIDIESTFDADIVLRKIIEDRASILALQGRAAANETELMKAR